jgi:methylthioribose-1-phosphate isomerase
MIDQRLIPQEIKYIEYEDAAGVAEAIRTMVIRGAPAIGAAAGYGMALAAVHSRATDPEELRKELEQAAEVLRKSRPTAHDLFYAVGKVLKRANDPSLKLVPQIQEAVLSEARRIADANVRMNRRMGLNALPLIPQGAKIFHHCNTGALATVDYGTALGVVRTAHEHGKNVFVYVDETRPRLQGARLTAWELEQLGIPYTVVVDGASGHIMRTRGADLCVVGCDRVAANGDTANKIGTFNLALAAHAHDVPFYVVGPTSTIDLTLPNGDEIPIEERPAEEVARIGDVTVTPEGAPVLNLAFDVTPAKYITAIITECGIAYPPFEESLREMMGRAALE